MQSIDNQIDKSVFDELLTGSIQTGKYVKIQYFTELHEFITINSLIKCPQNLPEDSILIVMNEEIVKLANLVSINGIYAPQYAYIEDFTCDC
jgi:Rho-binding antiterminator